MSGDWCLIPPENGMSWWKGRCIEKEGTRLGFKIPAMPKQCVLEKLLISWDKKGCVLL